MLLNISDCEAIKLICIILIKHKFIAQKILHQKDYFGGQVSAKRLSA